MREKQMYETGLKATNGKINPCLNFFVSKNCNYYEKLLFPHDEHENMTPLKSNCLVCRCWINLDYFAVF